MAELLVWFDGDCPLCRREIALMRRLDRRGAIRFIDVARGGPADCPIDRATLLARFHAREDGRVLSGAAAFAAMWRAIPVLRPLGLLARRPAVLALLERLYSAFLRVRPLLRARLHLRLQPRSCARPRPRVPIAPGRRERDPGDTADTRAGGQAAANARG